MSDLLLVLPVVLCVATGLLVMAAAIPPHWV